MLNDSQLLTALSERLSPGELPLALRRLLRVPEIWAGLHQPGFLDGLARGSELATLPLGAIVAHALGFASLPVGERLTEDREARLQAVWKQATEEGSRDSSLETIGLLATALVRALTTEGPQAVASILLKSPQTWHAPLACAWSLLPQPMLLLKELTAADDDGRTLAAKVLLANMAPEDAAKTLRSAWTGFQASYASLLAKTGEPEFARLLLDQAATQVEGPKGPAAAAGPREQFQTALEHRVRGEWQLARTALQRAWNASYEQAATIADQLAAVAEEEGDPVLALEARQQSLLAAGSPTRRAALALSFLDIGRPSEAMLRVSSEATTFEEQVAAGLTALACADPQAASRNLQDAMRARSLESEPGWLTRLAQGLHAVGLTDLALEVSGDLVLRFPIDTARRLEHASLLIAASDYEQAASHASIASALAPTSTTARRLLATALQTAGHPKEALAHWEVLASEESQASADLARCAMDADEIEVAERAIHALLDRDPSSAAGHQLMARLLLARGSDEQARGHLEQATRLAPHDPEPWIALASCQSQAGDDEAAGATLLSAAQLAPDSARLHAARASWLKAHGHLHEALEAMEKAMHLEPTEGEWAIERGDLLRSLGHHARALPVLREALSRKPGSTRARLSLALCYEAQGELASAARVLSGLPDEASAEVHLAAGRIEARAASLTKDPAHVARARTHLERAITLAPDDGEAHFWLGELHESTGDSPAALRSYSRAGELTSAADPSFQQRIVLGMARSALGADRKDLALRVLEEARSRYPGSVPFLATLSEAYLASGRAEEAVRVAQQAVELEPQSPQALRSLSHSASAKRDWPKALQALQQMTRLNPNDASTWLEYAKVSHQSGNLAEARSGLAHALRTAQGDIGALLATTSTLSELGWSRTAQAALCRATRRAPEDPLVHRELALLSEARGDLETAQRTWCRLAELRPTEVEPLTHGARALWNLGRRAAAIGLLQRAVSLQPGDPALHVDLARAYRDNGETPQSLNHYAHALQHLPDDIDLAVEAGAAAIRQGAPREAMEMLARARALAPDRPDVACSVAECLFRLDRHAECRQMLEALAHRVALPPQAGAMLALAHAATDGLAAATAGLDAAFAQPVKTHEDAVWLSRAAFRMGRWSASIRVLEDRMRVAEPSEVPTLLLQLAATRMDCIEIASLCHNAEVLDHAPRPEAEPERIEQELGGLIDQASRAGAPHARVRALRARLSLSFGDPAPEDIEVLTALTFEDGAAVLAILGNHLRHGRPAQMVDLLERTQPPASHASWAHLALGLAMEALSRLPEARRALQDATVDPLTRPVASFLIGRTWQTEGNTEKAKEALNAAVAAWPEEAAWHHRLASLYLGEHDLATALPHLQQAAELAPEDASIALTLGRALKMDGQLSQAKAAYTRALPAFPTDDTVWKEAGELALAVGDAEAAEAWFDRACTLSPSDARCLVGAARAAAALGKARLAADRAQAAARLAPSDPDVLVGLGEILARQGKVDKGLQAYDQALACGNKLPVTLARARLLIQIGRAGEAAIELKHLLDENPDSDQVWAALAEACDAARHGEEALQAAARAVRLAPRSGAHRLLLSRLSRQSGQLDRALKEVKEAQAINPADAAVFLELGRVYEGRRELNQALDSYQRAISLDQGSAEAHFQAGLIYKQFKAYGQAGRMFKRAVELNPKDSDAFHQLAAVNALELVHGGLVHPAVSA